jgi:hypothetical protein
VITVIDPEAARQTLAAGRLACPEPGCAGRLRVWSKARPRPVRGLDGRVQVIRPDRGLCRVCTVTQVLLPAFCLPRRGYRVEVVGAALLAAADGAGYARAAATCNVPTSTVRDWIRAVRRGVPALLGHTARLLQSSGDPTDMWPTPSRPVPPLTAALTALGAAAHGFAAWLTRPDTTAAGQVTGVDYLGPLLRQHRQDLVRRLRLADPSSAARHATPWQMVTVITAGRLLTGVPG